MARSLPDRGRRRLSGRAPLSRLLPIALVACCAATSASGVQLRGDIAINGINLSINSRDGSWSMDKVIIQGRDTRVSASHAQGTERAGGINEMNLTGDVQVDFRDVTLEAASALVVFRGDQLLSVQVQGRQARFSHQLPGTRRLSGSAGSISLDVPSSRLVLSGDTSYTDGCNRLTSSLVTYHMQEGTITDEGHPATGGRAVLCLDADEGSLDIDQYANLVINVRNDTVEAQDVHLRHGEEMRVQARSARQTRAAGNLTQLELGGDVRMDFSNATLDASRAVVAFNGDQLVSAEVSGDRVEFSHQPEGFPRRIQGRAGNIRYETATGKVVFSGETFFTDGCISTTTSNPFSYDINTGTATDDGDPKTRGRTTNSCLNLGRDRIPTPRTPERDSAQ